MKKSKKLTLVLPEVHIIGDLQDVKNLVISVNKKKSIVIFRDGDHETFFLEIEGKMKQIEINDLKKLKKEYRLIYFTFFPSRKEGSSIKEVIPEPVKPVLKAAKPAKEKGKKEDSGVKEKKEAADNRKTKRVKK
jgi:hypothetical protein